MAASLSYYLDPVMFHGLRAGAPGLADDVWIGGTRGGMQAPAKPKADNDGQVDCHALAACLPHASCSDMLRNFAHGEGSLSRPRNMIEGSAP